VSAFLIISNIIIYFLIEIITNTKQQREGFYLKAKLNLYINKNFIIFMNYFIFKFNSNKIITKMILKIAYQSTCKEKGPKTGLNPGAKIMTTIALI
jgi:hypothetical protein